MRGQRERGAISRQNEHVDRASRADETDTEAPGGTADGGEEGGASQRSGDAEPDPLSCWICRQPLDPSVAVRWRGEPVHPECR